MAVHASFTGKKVPPLIQLRCARQRTAMAFAAGRLDVLVRKDGLFPCQRTVVGFGNRCGSALATMADRAAELVQIVRHRWMLSIRLPGNIGKACFFQPDVASRAAINPSEFRQPDLLNSAIKMALQGIRLTAIAYQFQVAVLILAPLAEEVFCGRNRHRDQENDADDSERAYAVSKQSLPEGCKCFVHDGRNLICLETLPRPDPRPTRPAEEG